MAELIDNGTNHFALILSLEELKAIRALVGYCAASHPPTHAIYLAVEARLPENPFVLLDGFGRNLDLIKFKGERE